MRVFVFIIFSFLIYFKAHSTGQTPDYLILDNDTVPIFSNPLKQYFNQSGSKDIPEFQNSCLSTNCWRGYVAFWKLENDSLFLVRITGCPCRYEDSKDANLKLMFGSEIVFAYWYSGKLTVPKGELFSGSDMGYNAIYEHELLIEIESGNFKKQSLISNRAYIQSVKNENKLHEQILGLKDTILYYLNLDLDWEKLNNANLFCTDSYLLSYNENGILKDVKLITYHDDSTTLGDKFYYWRIDNKCSKKIKKALIQFPLSFLNPHRDFIIEIELFYREKLEMWMCRLHYERVSDEELEDYVRKQMNINE